MGIQYRMTGLKELLAKLEALPPKLAKRVIRPALQAGAEIIQQEMGILAPRETGFLTTNIAVSVVVHNDLAAEAHIGPDKAAWYGKFAELGTAPHTETSKNGKTWSHPGESPRPFMRPAIESKGGEAVQAMADEIRDGLKDVT
jgi:HK97 gp10 family phage protein